MTTTRIRRPTSTINEFADFWRHDVGVNVIPANTREKRPIIEWKEWQDKPIPVELHNRWKSENRFNDGMAVIAGKVWHNKQKECLYLNCIDADNAKAIEEICSRNGKGSITLQDLARWTLVEQHLDDPTKAHIYIYSNKPFAKKTSDNVINNNIDNNNAESPLIEVKGLGEHGIMFCSPSMHKNGHYYEILGIHNPVLADDYEHHIDTFLDKYGISYLNGNGKSKSRVPIEDLFNPDFKIAEGNNRHETILRVMESLIVRNVGILSLDEIKQMAVVWNNKHCLPPLNDKEFERQWKDASRFIATRNIKDKVLGSDNSNEMTHDSYATVDEENERLISDNKLSDEDINSVFDTMKKEAAYDELSIKQLFYAMASAFTKVPVHHIVNSKEAGAGKNYLLNLVSRYFPNQYVLPLSGMSNKALFHRKGILVIQDKETGELVPIAPMVNHLKNQIEELTEQIQAKRENKTLIKENKKRIRELEYEIKEIESNAQKRIQLDNQIIMCLDTPQSAVYDALMSIISQDTEREQQYSFVDKSGSGKLGTRDNILKGTPLLLTSQVIDDTKTSRFQEKNRRLINVNPVTSSEKIAAANNIIGLKGGYLPEEYDVLVVSRKAKENVKNLVKILVAKLKKHSKYLAEKEQGVKIPFALSITKSIPTNQVWGMTVADRTIKYLAIITKVHMDIRPKIMNEETGQFYPIAIFEDFKETLNLMQIGASGIRPYIVTWYNQVFLPCFNDLDGKPIEDNQINVDGRTVTIAKEKHVGVTTEQVAEKTKEVFGGNKLGSKELHDKYIYPLINQGVIEEVQSEIDMRRNIYFPLDGGNFFSVFEDLHVKVSNPSIFPSKTFLKGQLRILSDYSPQERVENIEKTFSHYKLIDVNGTEITVNQLLDQYFDKPEDCFIKDYVEAEPTNAD